MDSSNDCNVKRTHELRRIAGLVEHPAKSVRIDSAVALNEVGIYHFRHGKHRTAKKYFSQALSKSLNETSHLKENNEQHLISWLKSALDSEVDSHNPSGPNTACHEYDEGLLVYRTPLEICDRSPESISATLHYNIALTYTVQGIYRESRSCFVLALAYSPSPQDIFRILCNLGYASYHSGHNDKALFCYAHALQMAPRLGLSDVALAASMNSVAIMQFYKSDCDSCETLELLQKSLQLYQSDDARNINEIATVWNNIGRVQYLQSECSRALDSYEKALNIRKSQLGEATMDVAATYYNIGQAHQQNRDFEKAKEFYELFLHISLCCLGPMNTEVGIVYKCIGDIHFEEDDPQAALRAYEKSLAASRASLGRLHPTVAATLHKLGIVYYEMGDFEKSLRFYFEGLEIEMNVLSPNHPHIIITYSNIAHVYKLSGQYTKSLSLYKRVLEMEETVFGPQSLEASNTLSNIGLMEYNLKDFEASFESYQAALRIRRELCNGENHLCIAATLNSIGLVLFKQNYFPMAKTCFVHALSIRQSILGASHYDLAILWYNIATTNFETGDDDSAIQVYKEALRIERVHMGESHDDVIQTILHLAAILQQLGRLDEAALHYREALGKLQKKKVRDFLREVRLLNLLGNLYLQQGDVANAIETLTNATRSLRVNNLSDDSFLISGLNYYSLSRMHPPCASVA